MQDAELKQEAQQWRSVAHAFYQQQLNQLHLHVNTGTVPFKEFLWAYALVDNRAFSFDMVKGRAASTVIVPLLDMLNHTHRASPDQRFQEQVWSINHLPFVQSYTAVLPSALLTWWLQSAGYTCVKRRSQLVVVC